MRKLLSRFCSLGVPLAFLFTGMVGCSGSEEGSQMTVASTPAPEPTTSPVADAPRQPVSTIEALLAAATRGDKETVKLLLEAGVHADVKDADDSTALILAARAGHGEIAALLLNAHADSNGADRHGMTPLMAAAGAGHLDVVRILLAAGADLSAHDSTGLTALMWAEKSGHTQIETLLAPKGLPPENARVARLQRFLIELGYDPGPVDGLYGPQTAAAVRDYQRQTQLPITGLVTEELVKHARQSLRERRLARGQPGQGG
jgi:hypothetical protein